MESSNDIRRSAGTRMCAARLPEERVIIAGAGGQGVMLAGKILATAAMEEGRNVTWFPSYGAEVRGGTAHCMVVISSVAIGSPWVEKADAVIAMNELSARKFLARVRPRGAMILNASLCPPDVCRCGRAFPFTGIAAGLGDVRIANMVALGCYAALRRTIKLSTISRVIERIAPPDKRQLIAVNQQALDAGAALGA